LLAAARSASAKITFGLLPPSSIVTFLSVAAALRTMSFPVSVPPVNEIFATSGCFTSASPASSPKPVTTFNTPGGKPASPRTRASRRMLRLASSGGFTTIVLPAASAGAIFRAASRSGKFQGTIAATTPSGSRSV
jgi:hypothetical protein